MDAVNGTVSSASVMSGSLGQQHRGRELDSELSDKPHWRCRVGSGKTDRNVALCATVSSAMTAGPLRMTMLIRSVTKVDKA